MRAIELTGPSIDALRHSNLPDPVPGPGEVLVGLRAASLNFIDIAVANGHFPVPRFPMIPVADGAGEVVQLGPGVEAFKPGDRVIPHFMPRWLGGPITAANVASMRGVTMPGSLAEYVVVPEHSLVPMPSYLGFAEAATLPIAGTTAWRALRAARVAPGSVVVLLGTGGVSVMALQLAKASGATVVVTSSSDQKLERAKALGADRTINYRAVPNWDEEVLAYTHGRGADLVIDTGGTDTFARSVNAAAYGGVVFSIGFISGASASVDLLKIIAKGLSVQGNNTGPVSDLAETVRAFAAHRLKPLVDAEFEFNDAAAAYAHLAGSGQHFGKISIVH